MYMEELKEEIYEESLEFEWRRVIDSDYEMSSSYSSDSDYSFTESE
jgi:hypothetical protein